MPTFQAAGIEEIGRAGTRRHVATYHISMRMRHACLSLAALAAVSACSGIADVRNGGAPCGRNQHAHATVVLPDTGIESNHELQVDFIQHDPDLSGELSEVVVQFTAPGASVVDSNPVPRVRLLNSDGLVFVDTLGNNSGGRPTWYVLRWIKDAPTRNALYDAFASQTVWLELWNASATKPGTRVRFDVKEYGTHPPAICL